MAETGKLKSTKKLPPKLEWETPSPPRRRLPKSQQHQYTDPLRSSRVERTNPTLPNTHLVGMGMYTAWQNQGPPPPTSGADEATGGEGEPSKSLPETWSLSIRPFLLWMGTSREEGDGRGHLICARFGNDLVPARRLTALVIIWEEEKGCLFRFLSMSSLIALHALGKKVVPT